MYFKLKANCVSPVGEKVAQKWGHELVNYYHPCVIMVSLFLSGCNHGLFVVGSLIYTTSLTVKRVC